MSKPKNASGPNIGDEERNTVKMTLRLPPELAEEIRMLANQWNCYLSVVVAAGIAALRVRDPPAKDGE